MAPQKGMKRLDTSGLGEALFSKTQRRVLSILFGNPETSFYTNEIVRYAEVGIGSVQREIEKLAKAGLLTVEKKGNQKHYSANRNSPIFEELRSLVQKTFGLADVLRNALVKYRGGIAFAFIYGSIAKGTDKAESDIDVMVVSDQLSYPDVFSSFAAVEAEVRRPVNPTIYTVEEFKKKIDSDNNFVIKVLSQPKIFLIGSENDLPKS